MVDFFFFVGFFLFVFLMSFFPSVPSAQALCRSHCPVLALGRVLCLFNTNSSLME